jgi:DNA-binding response OmpR family regulator
MNVELPRVLIIDDEEETLNLLKIALEKNGFRAITASNWEEVASHVELADITRDPIQAIVLDIMMPGRSGFDILTALKVVLIPMPPVIMLSAVTGIEQQIRARDLGAVKYITKPTTPSALIQAVRDVLEKSGL